jgi:hypothetical protein
VNTYLKAIVSVVDKKEGKILELLPPRFCLAIIIVAVHDIMGDNILNFVKAQFCDIKEAILHNVFYETASCEMATIVTVNRTVL